MNKALLFKEWIKTRWMFLLMFVVFILAMGYIALRISSAARNVGMPHLWEVFILKNVVLLDQIKVLPLLAGIIMGITQFIPEMTKKRFKLTLHLPLGENRIVCLMLSYGIVCLLLLFTVSYGGFLWGLSADFPREVVGAWFATILPQVLCGFASYLLTAWIILEPVWSQRIYNAMIGLLILSLFMVQGVPGSYIYMLPFLFGTLILLALYPKISIRHFKEGMQ